MSPYRDILLVEFLKGEARRGFAWGQDDCALLVADWLWCAAGKKDPAVCWRGRYRTQEEADAAMGWGGVQKIVAREARALGLMRTFSPVAGDIGVVAPSAVVSGIGQCVAGIRAGDGWVMRSMNGLLRMTDLGVRVLAAWAVPVECRDDGMVGSADG